MTHSNPQAHNDSAPSPAPQTTTDRTSEAFQLANDYTSRAFIDALKRNPENSTVSPGISLGSLLIALNSFLGFRVSQKTALMLVDDANSAVRPRISSNHRSAQLAYSTALGFNVSEQTTMKLEAHKRTAALQDQEAREKPLREYQREYTPRVNREYSLPVEAFDYLKGYQRRRQGYVDPLMQEHTVTNSEALTYVIWDHSRLEGVARSLGYSVATLCAAIANGTLTVSRVTPVEAA